MDCRYRFLARATHLWCRLQGAHLFDACRPTYILYGPFETRAFSFGNTYWIIFLLVVFNCSKRTQEASPSRRYQACSRVLFSQKHLTPQNSNTSI
jgi:hypothetical protein